MKDRIELFVSELTAPVERREILGYKIATIAGEVLEITGAKIIDDRETRIWESLL